MARHWRYDTDDKHAKEIWQYLQTDTKGNPTKSYRRPEPLNNRKKRKADQWPVSLEQCIRTFESEINPRSGQERRRFMLDEYDRYEKEYLEKKRNKIKSL